MQYWPYLWLPGVQLISRYQIAFAMLMFVGSPAWIGLLVLGTLALAAAGTPSAVHPPRRRHGAVRHHPHHVVRAEDRDRDRRGVAARNCAAPSAAPAASSRASSPRRSSS